MRPADQQQQYRLGEEKCGQNDSEMCHQLFEKTKHVSRIFPVVFVLRRFSLGIGYEL